MQSNELKIEYLPVADLKPYENNAKLHPEVMHIKECELKTSDLIIQRWENFTGEKAVLLNG